MRKHPQLHGLLFYPSSLTQRDHEKTIFSSTAAIRKNFRKTYENHIAYMKIVEESAKIYILNNYTKVRDWRDLQISIVDNSGKEIFYYRYTKRKVKCYSKFAEYRNRKINTKNKKNHNPVKKVSDAILDTSDGDFSIKINGKQHNWIDAESVIVLADYIEGKLNQK